MLRSSPLLWPLSLLAACVAAPADDPTPEPGPAQPIPWPLSPPPLDGLAHRGFVEQRGIVHLHSHHSHDACDGDPQPGGVPDEVCLADLREGLCLSGIDVAFLSDHPAHAEEAEFEELLLLRDGDEAVLGEDGWAIANRMLCPDGRRVLLLPGVESDLMPLGLQLHAPGAYHSLDGAAVAAARDAGGLAWLAHTEGRTFGELLPLGLDGIEIYQLHANLDPDIREDFLGLGAFDYLSDLRPFFFAEADDPLEPPHPDLAPLGFLAPNEPSLTMLETLGQHQRLSVTGGTDAHRNVFASEGTDGDRLDSYRRMLRWFNTRVRVADPLDPTAAREALREGRSYVVVESLGTPDGFDLYVADGAIIHEMGEEFSFEPGLEIVLDVPTLNARSAQGLNPPRIVGRIYGNDGTARVLVDEAEAGRLTAVLPGPGVYRAEVWIEPHHLAPYMGGYAEPYVSQQLPWIWSGAFFVR